MGRPPSLRRKNNARKSTGGTSRQVGSQRQRVTARKSTGGYSPRFHMSRYPQAQEDSSSNDTMDEDEGGGNNSEDINEVYVSSIAGRSAYPSYGDLSKASSSTNPQSSSSLELNIAQQQQDRVVVRIPQPRMSPFQPGFRRSESPRGQNEAAVASAVSAAAFALKTSAGCTSPGRSGQSLVDEPENSIQIGGDAVDEDVTSADSTNVIPEILELCEPSSTSATTTAFVPPPAVPGHSRWLLAQDNIAMKTPSNIEPDCCPDPTTRPRKKKHFTPLPFPESSPPKLNRNSSSLQNPFFTNDDPPPSISKDPQSDDFSTKKIKKAFRNFQSIRRLVTDSGVCSHFNGFVQLNAVEQMLIKCYNRVKRISNERSYKSSNPPVIVLDDSGDVVRCDPVKQTSSFDDDGEDDIDTISIQVSPPTLSSDVNVEKTSTGGDSTMSVLDTYGESSPQSSLNSTTSILVGGKNVAKKNASVICSPAAQISKSSRGKRSSSGSSRMNLSTVGSTDHVDEVINTVIRDQQQSRTMTGASSSSVMPNDDILAQFSESHRRTLNSLVHMGFGSKDGDNFDQLVRIVHEKNGNLDACIDRLTKLA
ncbi:uncharacterized protein LOC110843809 isoform X2 [Folsomia candida]|uniref:uncharacterized protein LOC110843809 isoform X2 n=1 Tax=Folsomia candida TaxID=158441 RepID=UPI00160509EE|nr:uncharacterized protein LOC110843809 isoform X2 [Folsomia candida]